MSLVRSGMGSVELPEEITMYCPQCGTEVADKGQCLAELRPWPDPNSKTGFVVKLTIDCRTCGCLDREPTINFFKGGINENSEIRYWFTNGYRAFCLGIVSARENRALLPSVRRDSS